MGTPDGLERDAAAGLRFSPAGFLESGGTSTAFQPPQFQGDTAKGSKGVGVRLREDTQ
jgi:hypothetical protein